MSMLYADSPGRWVITSAKEGRSQASWTPTSDMANPFGNVHGGVIATVIDEITGAAIMTSIEAPSAPTVSLHVDYLYGIAIGENYIAIGEIARIGRALAIVDAQILNDEGKVFARGTCMFQIPRSAP
jgi:uncharacterized protein (TIGR00369 family)